MLPGFFIQQIESGFQGFLNENHRICLDNLNLGPIDLSQACFVDASLRGTNLSACMLSSIDLFDAQYDDDTTWPRDFDPQERGAKHV